MTCQWKCQDGSICGSPTGPGEVLVLEPWLRPSDDLCAIHVHALRREREERAQVALELIRKAAFNLDMSPLERHREIINALDWAAATEKTATGKAAVTSVTAEVVTNV